MTTECLIRALEVERKLHRRICAELRRRQHEEAIYPHDVAKAVHGRLKPDASLELGYIRDMIEVICRRSMGDVVIENFALLCGHLKRLEQLRLLSAGSRRMRSHEGRCPKGDDHR